MRRSLKQLALLSQSSKTCRSLTTTKSLPGGVKKEKEHNVLDTEWAVDADGAAGAYDDEDEDDHYRGGDAEEREQAKTNGKKAEEEDMDVDRVSNPMYQWQKINVEMKRIMAASW